MDPQSENQNQQSSGSRIRMPSSIEKRMFRAGTKMAVRLAVNAGRFVFMWIVQTIVPLITILFVTIATFIITLLAGD